MQHLRSHNNRLLCQCTFFDQHTLDTRYLFLRHLNTQVTTSNHYSISHFQNLIDIVYPFLIFNLGNDTDVTTIIIQNLSNIENILFSTHKRMRNIVDITFDSKKNIITILFGQRRKIDTNSRHIHTLTISKSRLILYLTHQIFVTFFNHTKFQITIVNQNRTSDLQILHKIRIGNRNTFTTSFLFRIARHFHQIANMKRNRFLVYQSCRAYFRPLGIHENRNAIGNRTHIRNQFLKTFP